MKYMINFSSRFFLLITEIRDVENCTLRDKKCGRVVLKMKYSWYESGAGYF